MINRKQVDRIVIHEHAVNRLAAGGEGGYVLVTVMLILMIAGIMAIGGVNLSHLSGESAHTAIQRGRAIQASDSGTTVAERALLDSLSKRLFADDTATEGIFLRGKIDDYWWRTDPYPGEHKLPTGEVIGVIVPPRYVVEEFGRFVSDGGTGIVSLDMGSGAYGRGSRSGRDIVVYRVESQGRGSLGNRQSVVESVMAFSY